MFLNNIYTVYTLISKTISGLCTHANQNQLKQMLLKQYLDCVQIENQNQLKQMLLKQYLDCVHIDNQNQLKLNKTISRVCTLKQYLDCIHIDNQN